MNLPLAKVERDSISLVSIHGPPPRVQVVRGPPRQQPIKSTGHDKGLETLNRVVVCCLQTINGGCGYLLGSQVPRGPIAARMLSGAMGLILVNVAVTAIASYDMSPKGRWICAALSIATITSGFFSGAFIGF